MTDWVSGSSRAGYPPWSMMKQKSLSKRTITDILLFWRDNRRGKPTVVAAVTYDVAACGLVLCSLAAATCSRQEGLRKRRRALDQPALS